MVIGIELRYETEINNFKFKFGTETQLKIQIRNRNSTQNSNSEQKLNSKYKFWTETQLRIQIRDRNSTQNTNSEQKINSKYKFETQPRNSKTNQPILFKIYKTANVMSLSFDGASKVQQTKFMKGSATETSNFPLYLGGVPAGHSYPGLDSMEPFVGCIKNLQFGDRPRRKKSVKLEDVTVEGDVSKSGCPIN